MSIPLMEYSVMPVYTKIAHRFRSKYNIQLGNHIDMMSHVSYREEEGITFVPKRDTLFIDALKSTGAFHHDDRNHVVLAAAASQTKGEGYREIADSSLHCQVGKGEINVHIDYLGFVWRGPSGESLVGPDALRHIVDELGWGKIVEAVGKKSQIAGKILERARPLVPSSANKFVPMIGVSYDLIRGESLNMSKQWSLSVQYRFGCTDYTCSRTEEFKGLVFDFKH